MTRSKLVSKLNKVIDVTLDSETQVPLCHAYVLLEDLVKELRVFALKEARSGRF